MPPLPNPRETIVRNVFFFPADGTEPRIIPKTFSEAGSKANPESFFTIAVDLRGHYRKHMASTYCRFVDNSPNPITLKCNEGEFIFYSNVSPELPINKSVAQVVGIDPIAFESKIFWRGDVIVVKAQDWPGPLAIGGGNHKLYHDVDPSFQATAELVLRNTYKLDDHKEWIRDTVSFSQGSVRSGACFLSFFSGALNEGKCRSDRAAREYMQAVESPPIPISNMKPLDLNHRSEYSLPQNMLPTKIT